MQQYNTRPYAGAGAHGAPAPSGGSGTDDLLQQMISHLNGIHIVLNAILQEIQERNPIGIVLKVTFLTTDINPPVVQPFNPMLFSIDLTNDGPGVIQYSIPQANSGAWIDLNPTENVRFSFPKGVIPNAIFRAKVAGANGSIRLLGTY